MPTAKVKPLASVARNYRSALKIARFAQRHFRAGARMRRRPYFKHHRNVRKVKFPARFGPRKSTYIKNRQISKVVRSLAETKLLPVSGFNEKPPLVPVNASAPNLRYINCLIGDQLPTGWDSQTTLLDGVKIAPGTGAQQRIGSYVYLKKTTLMFDIDMQSTGEAGSKPPIEFRVVVLKPKRYSTQAGITLAPSKGMFLNDVGGEIGYETAYYNTTDFLRRPLNRRNFQVAHDQRFVMSQAENIMNNSGYSGYYPCFKSFQVSLPYYKKVKYDGGNRPYDIDTHWSLIILARPLGKDTIPDNWEMNLRGTTSYTDL